MVNAKQKRLERSRQHNPLWGKRKRQVEKNEEVVNNEEESKKRAKRKKKSTITESKEADNDDVESFAGTTGKLGVHKLNSKFFLKKQASLHGENLKQQKKKAKGLKQLTSQKKEQALNRREAKPKQGTKKPDADEVNFNRLVNSYKKKLSAISNFKSKWFET